MTPLPDESQTTKVRFATNIVSPIVTATLTDAILNEYDAIVTVTVGVIVIAIDLEFINITKIVLHLSTQHRFHPDPYVI